MEITYHWEGDYLIPDLKLSDTTEYQIGKYGRMRQRFLVENYRGIYSHMLLSETLWKHFAEVDEEYAILDRGEFSCLKIQMDSDTISWIPKSLIREVFTWKDGN